MAKSISGITETQNIITNEIIYLLLEQNLSMRADYLTAVTCIQFFFSLANPCNYAWSLNLNANGVFEVIIHTQTFLMEHQLFLPQTKCCPLFAFLSIFLHPFSIRNSSLFETFFNFARLFLAHGITQLMWFMNNNCLIKLLLHFINYGMAFVFVTKLILDLQKGWNIKWTTLTHRL